MNARTEPRTYRMADHKGWGNTMFWFRNPDENVAFVDYEEKRTA